MIQAYWWKEVPNFGDALAPHAAAQQAQIQYGDGAGEQHGAQDVYGQQGGEQPENFVNGIGDGGVVEPLEDCQDRHSAGTQHPV